MIFHFPSDLKRVKEASQEVLNFLADMHLDDETTHHLRLCFEEAFINAVKYGNKFDPHLTVDVEIAKKPDTVELIVSDRGEGFDFKEYKDPTLEENLMKTRGRGVFLIRKYMDEVIFKCNGSCIHMIKKIRRD